MNDKTNALLEDRCKSIDLFFDNVANNSNIKKIKIDKLVHFENHPFKMYFKEKLEGLGNSI